MSKTRSKALKSTGEDADQDMPSSQLQQILSKLDENKASADKQYQSLLTAINKINSRLDALELEQQELAKGLDFTNQEVTELQKKHESLSSTVADLKDIIDNRQADKQNVINAVDKIENEKNQKALIISNIPESRNEDSTKVILTLAEHLGAQIHPTDIETTFRIKNDSAPKPPLIMIKFNNSSARENLYNARKNFNKKAVTTSTLGFRGSSKNIYINEVLSKTQQKLFFLARKKKVELKWRYVWTYRGQVFMRQTKETDAIKIASTECLSQLTATTPEHNGQA